MRTPRWRSTREDLCSQGKNNTNCVKGKYEDDSKYTCIQIVILFLAPHFTKIHLYWATSPTRHSAVSGTYFIQVGVHSFHVSSTTYAPCKVFSNNFVGVFIVIMTELKEHKAIMEVMQESFKFCQDKLL